MLAQNSFVITRLNPLKNHRFSQKYQGKLIRKKLNSKQVWCQGWEAETGEALIVSWVGCQFGISAEICQL